MEVRRASRETAKYGSLNFANVVKFSVDQRQPEVRRGFAVIDGQIGGRILFADNNHGQVGDIEAAHIAKNAGLAGVAGADVERSGKGVVANIGSIVTGSTSARKRV